MRNIRFIVTFINFLSNVKNKFITFIRKCFNSIKNECNYARVLSPIRLRNIVLPLIYSMAGWIINILAENKFPDFLVMWGLLFIIILITRSTTSRIAKLNSNLDQEMAGDNILVTLKVKYQKKCRSNKNHILSIGGALLIVYLSYALLHINITISIKIYCFLSLLLIVICCINGALQYYYLLVFLYNIAKSTSNIENYDNELPYRTKWLNYITKEAHFCNIMYFITGTFIIFLLNRFMFTSTYGVQLTNRFDMIYCVLFWIIIIIFIVIGFPVLTIIGYINIRNVISGLKERSETLLKNSQLSADENLRINISRYIIEFNNTPGYPTKHPVSYIVTIFVGGINLLTSMYSVFELFSKVSQSI